jgi:hypothetical protein
VFVRIVIKLKICHIYEVVLQIIKSVTCNLSDVKFYSII